MDQLALLIPQSAPQAPSRTREVRDTRATTSEKDFAKTFESTLKQAEKNEPLEKTERPEKSEPSASEKSGEKAKTDDSETIDSQTSSDDSNTEDNGSDEPTEVVAVADPLIAILVPEALLGNQGPQSPQVSQPTQGVATNSGMVQASELMKIAPTDLNIKEITVIKGLPADASLKPGDATFGQQFAKVGGLPVDPQVTAPVLDQAAVGSQISQTIANQNATLPQVVQAQALELSQASSTQNQPIPLTQQNSAFKLETAETSDTSDSQGVAPVPTNADGSVSTLPKIAQQKSQSQNSENSFETPDKDLEAVTLPKKAEKSKEHFEISEAPQKAELKAKVEVTQEVKESVATQVVRQTRDAFGKGRTEIRIQLNPETLGGLTLKVTHQDGVVRAHIVADSPQTKELLESQLSSLRNQFAEQGVRVERIEVVAKNPMGFESTMDQRQQSSQQQQPESQRRQVPQESFGTSTMASGEGEVADEETTGSLDVKA